MRANHKLTNKKLKLKKKMGYEMSSMPNEVSEDVDIENGKVTEKDRVIIARRKRLFFVQFLFSLVVLVWLIIQLSFVEDANWRTALFSTLSGLLGFWLPSPLS